jgi:methionyl-tRNA formyltransferase
LKNNGDVCGIITMRESVYNSDYADLTPIALQYDIPIYYCNNVNDSECIEWIKKLKPDIIFCWGWSQLLKEEILNLSPMGVVGAHPALLPHNRGRHPLIWTLVLGLKESGLTFFFMDQGADSGPILSQRKFEIDIGDTAATLYKKIEDCADEQIADFLPRLINGNYDKIEQECSKANYWRKRTKADGRIDWRMSSLAIYNLVRALTKPYPGAYFEYDGNNIIVWQAKLVNKKISMNIEPGKVIDVTQNGIMVKTYDGAIVISDYEPKINLDKGVYL